MKLESKIGMNLIARFSYMNLQESTTICRNIPHGTDLTT